ncbi:hypothetical protein J1605_004189 [Eschrichtius robustus]|uniref:Uncharacterized protein n=1 Tax=Eschrichtius robustus TaxID=9764 RepID=A0AB34HK41_ESCRO|nr:hypothetical protein J1605_004189 [Eschrichtius robustus]
MDDEEGEGDDDDDERKKDWKILMKKGMRMKVKKMKMMMCKLCSGRDRRRVSSDVLVDLTVRTVSILFSQDEISAYYVLGRGPPAQHGRQDVTVPNIRLNLGVSNNVVMELDPRSSDRRPWQAAIHNKSGVEVKVVVGSPRRLS